MPSLYDMNFLLAVLLLSFSPDFSTSFAMVHALAPISHRQSPGAGCRVLPGDPSWPSEAAWSELNSTVNGRLIKTVPLGSVCHEPAYEQSQCELLASGWIYSQTHYNSSSSIVAPFFQNGSCDPFTAPSSPCRIGNYPDYAIQVHEAADAAAGLAFAKKNNVRLVIKNTGHDLLGRSVGKGSLSLWTQSLQDIKVIDYLGMNYNGKAMKMAAGVQAYRAYAAAHANGLRVVGGSCPTVGLAGGYTQGGGHSMLSSIYGMGADQVLEWQVVTADGKEVVASPTQNADLYWALSGGGPGTYGVAMAMTVKLYPEGLVTGVSLNIAKGNSTESFLEAVNEFHGVLESWTKLGATMSYILTGTYFSMEPAMFPSKEKGEVQDIIRPLCQRLDAINATYSLNVTTFNDYYTFFNATFGPLPYGPYSSAQVQGGSLVPRHFFKSAQTAQSLTQVLGKITTENPGFQAIGVGFDVRGMNKTPNAVLPQWRDSLMSVIIKKDWNYFQDFQTNAANEKLITEKLDPQLDTAMGMQAGAYMNEGDFQRSNYAEKYYGVNYAALEAIKRKYDPDDIFYGTTLIGSKSWKIENDGRLCRA